MPFRPSPRRAIRIGALAVALSFALLSATWPHGDVHEEIVALTKQIEATPAAAALFLRRGQLHRAHRDWTVAAADFDYARELDPTLSVTDLARGEMLAEAGRAHEAIVAFDRFLLERPEHSAGYAGRARAHSAARQWECAAEDFARAITCEKQPEPELFVAQSHALRAAGRIEDAIGVLDAGIMRLGALITFTQPAIDFEVEAGHIDAALARLARVIQAAPRKERWLLRRGELFEKAGRLDAARDAFASARSALAEVPADRRTTAAMQDLEKSIAAALARTAAR